MKDISKTTILFVDDEPCMRELMAMILTEEGFEVSTAADGLEALAQLRDSIPDLIISDLQMPRMSGIELLSVVRRRFPAIPVIAVSGAFDMGGLSPSDVMADAFFPKSRCHPDKLVETIRELVYKPLSRPTNYHPCQPPKVQTARNAHDGRGNSSRLLTCTECLRVFSWTIDEVEAREIQQADCQFCLTPVSFVDDVSVSAPQAMMTLSDAAPMSAA